MYIYMYALPMTSTITVDVACWNIEWRTLAQIVLFDLKIKNMSCMYGVRTNVHPLQGIWDYNTLRYLVNVLSLMCVCSVWTAPSFAILHWVVCLGRGRNWFACQSVLCRLSVSASIYIFFRGRYTCCSIFCRVNKTIEFNSFWHRYLRQSFCKHRIRIRQQFRKI